MWSIHHQMSPRLDSIQQRWPPARFFSAEDTLSPAPGRYGHPPANSLMKQMKSSTVSTGGAVLASQLA
jgi:hypothetical protein